MFEKAPILDIKKFNGTMPLDDSDDLKKFVDSQLDQRKDYPPPVPVISLMMNGEAVPFLSRRAISLWHGKQKSRKTTALALAAAGFISKSSDDLQIYFQSEGKGKVIFFDCEQGLHYAARTMKLILKLSGVAICDRLIYSDLREYEPQERLKIIKAGIENTEEVSLVIIDGLVDMMVDWMDAAEGHFVVNTLLRLTSLYNLHIAVILHQNRGDKNPRAHVGQIASQKCELEIQTEIDPHCKAQSIVSCVNSRGLPFDPFRIRWDRGSLPDIVQDETTITAEGKLPKNFEKAREIAEAVFPRLKALGYGEAIRSIMNASHKSQSTAKRLLDDLVLWGLVAKGADGNYRLGSGS